MSRPSPDVSTAVVVGGGPNGLAAAITLAEAGVDVTVLEATDEAGGGMRSGEALIPGMLHDHCAAIHPMAVGSPFLGGHSLEKYGLRWAWPQVDCAHPLDDGTAGALFRSVTRTAEQLGVDDRAWRWLFERTAQDYGQTKFDIMGPLLRLPSHPVKMARFGLPAVLPATALAAVFRTERARALFGGVAAHAFQRLDRPLSAAVGLGILTAGHHDGWPVAIGGSQAIAAAMVALLAELGGKIETGLEVTSFTQLPIADVVMWDVAPTALVRILGDRLPPRVARALSRFRYGPAAYKVDFAVEGGVPWAAPEARQAGTVHLGGTFAEIASTERAVAEGRMPASPFVLVGQQYLADPGRSVGDLHPIYCYAHVPQSYTGDAYQAVVDQIERFAPGFQDRIVAHRVITPADFSTANSNYVGGNILTGAKDIRQLVFGPRITPRPYHIGVKGHFLCSAATPPGPGAHGMCGVQAARRAMRELA